MTAAHCIENDHTYTVKAGAHRLDKVATDNRVQTRKVTKIAISINYRTFNDNIRGDIAMLQLESGFELNKYVKLIPLVNENKLNERHHTVEFPMVGDKDCIMVSGSIFKKKFNKKVI